MNTFLNSGIKLSSETKNHFQTDHLIMSLLTDTKIQGNESNHA